MGGVGLGEIARKVEVRLDAADEAEAAGARAGDGPLPDAGIYHFRRGGEAHLWRPETVAMFRKAVMEGARDLFRQFEEAVDGGSAVTRRALLDFAEVSAGTALPLAAVEPAESIVSHFVAGAMSLGSLSPEAHVANARAMNGLGAMSNSGEGGEDPERFGTPDGSAIKQVASARFGGTIAYLRSARDLQIKMAQGAKPGEGGQLPGDKVDAFVARIRHSTPGVTLIPPPPATPSQE